MQDIDFVMLGNRVAAARRLRGIRQYELAERTGVHPVTLSRLEHGNLPGVTLAVIARVAMALGVSLDELLGWQPTHPGLIDDLERGHYFRKPSA